MPNYILTPFVLLSLLTFTVPVVTFAQSESAPNAGYGRSSSSLAISAKDSIANCQEKSQRLQSLITRFETNQLIIEKNYNDLDNGISKMIQKRKDNNKDTKDIDKVATNFKNSKTDFSKKTDTFMKNLRSAQTSVCTKSAKEYTSIITAAQNDLASVNTAIKSSWDIIKKDLKSTIN